MLKEVDSNDYYHFFQKESNPFLFQKFIDLNAGKAERVLRLLQDKEKPTIGVTMGVIENKLYIPFSAPFGGFHYNHENIYMHEIEEFVDDLNAYVIQNNYDEVTITFAPSIYESTFNAKIIHVLFRNKYTSSLPDITNWVDLKAFNNHFNQKNSREYYSQSIRNELRFASLNDIHEKISLYNLVKENRARFDRPIYMTFEDILTTSLLWKTDFFGVYSKESELVAGGIFYQFPNTIAFAVFWGDSETGRPLRAMDFLSFNVFSHYKANGFSVLDLGVSTEKSGLINEGLLRFKEMHEAKSELKHTLIWTKPENV